jgi:hypothetical protein
MKNCQENYKNASNAHMQTHTHEEGENERKADFFRAAEQVHQDAQELLGHYT